MRTLCFSFSALFGGCLMGWQSAVAQQGVAVPDLREVLGRMKQLEDLVSRHEQKIEEIEAALSRQTQSERTAPTVLNSSTETRDQDSSTLTGTQIVPEGKSRSTPTAAGASAQVSNPEYSETPSGSVAVGRNTFSIVSRDQLFQLRIGAHLQADGKTLYGDKSYYDESPHQFIDEFIVRRARPILEGNLGQYVEFRIMATLGMARLFCTTHTRISH